MKNARNVLILVTGIYRY